MKLDYHTAENADPPHIAIFDKDSETTLCEVYLTEELDRATAEHLVSVFVSWWNELDAT